mgnify:CR=1 FL=1
MNQHIESVILQFDIPDGAWTAEPYGNGHINDTYLIAAGEKHFILQRVNGYVFPEPEDVIENIERVTDFLKEQIAREGGDPERETLTLVKTQQGTHFAYDEQGNLWKKPYPGTPAWVPGQTLPGSIHISCPVVFAKLSQEKD